MDSVSRRFYGRLTDINRATEMFKGMLGGLAADYKITDDEIASLFLWFQRHENLLDRPPFADTALLICRILEDEVVEEDEREELVEWFQMMNEPNSTLAMTLTDATRRLHGLMDGISMDGEVSEAEVRDLWDWLQDYEWARENWPFWELWEKLERVLKDGRISSEEQHDLLEYCRNFGENTPVTSIRRREFDTRKEPWMLSEAPVLQSIACVCDDRCKVIIPEHSYCFTGTAVTGKRKDLEALVKLHGGEPQPRITAGLHYLVVGDLSNPVWAFASYGRKIEAAIENKKRGSGTKIIREARFIKALELH